MPKIRRKEFPDFAGIKDGWLLYLKEMPTVIGETAVNFFKDSFNRQGFIDKSFERWTPRNHKYGHKILMKSLFLQNSIKVVEANHNRVEVAPVTGTEHKYAQIHNEGGTINATIPITAKSRKFFWYMFKKTGDTKWKAMALTKKTAFQTSFTMPKRQFIGTSEFLMKRLEMNNKKSIDEIIKVHFKKV